MIGIIKWTSQLLISWQDAIVVPLLFFLLCLIGFVIKYKNRQNILYQYYMRGLIIKLLCGVLLCFIYVYYYGGGDTVGYFTDGFAMVELLKQKPMSFLHVMVSKPDLMKMWSLFDINIGYPYYLKDPHAFFVVKLTLWVIPLALNSFIGSSLIVAFITYGGIWRLYLVLCENYPDLYKKIAIAVLFVPSAVFWSSGLLKDSITLSAIGWFVYGFFNSLIKKRSMFWGILYMVIASTIILKIKPYIFFALLPGTIIWFFSSFFDSLRYRYVKTIIIPIVSILALAIGYNSLTLFDEMLGVYSVDMVFKKAAINQYDLKQDYYGKNSFDIGEFDASLESSMGKAHLAIPAALFRPFVWESRGSPVVMIAGIENLFMLIFTILVFLRAKITGFFIEVFQNSLLTFSFMFTIIFAFGVGLSTANFGALVRYKIPMIPFYATMLIVVWEKYKRK